MRKMIAEREIGQTDEQRKNGGDSGSHEQAARTATSLASEPPRAASSPWNARDWSGVALFGGDQRVIILNAPGFTPGGPNPDLLTEEEAIRYLRLDTIDIKNPFETLRYYRKEGLLKGTQVSKRVFYLRGELDCFLAKVTSENPR
jgi:hypothetical protein